MTTRGLVAWTVAGVCAALALGWAIFGRWFTIDENDWRPGAPTVHITLHGGGGSGGSGRGTQ